MVSPIKKGRFNTEREILDAIDRVRGNVNRLRTAAQKLNAKGNDSFEKFKKSFDMKFMVERDNFYSKADRKNSKADKIEKGYLTQLKWKLSEFRTEILPGMLPDKSIPK
jgi:hypothetical protein